MFISISVMPFRAVAVKFSHASSKNATSVGKGRLLTMPMCSYAAVTVLLDAAPFSFWFCPVILLLSAVLPTKNPYRTAVLT